MREIEIPDKGGLALVNSDSVRMLFNLSILAEQKNGFSVKHVTNVSELTRQVAQLLGLEEVEAIALAAACHDVGKLGVPRRILQHERELLKAEFERMKEHTLLGAEIVNGLAQTHKGNSRFFRYAEDVALLHHENCDGSGYPYGLTEREIPIHVKIVTVVDVFDALTSPRPYKKPWSDQDALTYLEENNSKFDREVLRAFREVVKNNHKKQEEGHELSRSDLTVWQD